MKQMAKVFHWKRILHAFLVGVSVLLTKTSIESIDIGKNVFNESVEDDGIDN